jgi:CRISPR-associated protein Cmr3
MRLFLKPNDTFFFRDGRPFTRGEQSEGYSIETPFPSTVMGALRTAHIAFCGDMTQFANGEMKSVIGTKQSLSGASIQIKGVFLGRGDGPLYYPTPRDLVSEKKSESAKLYPLSIESQRDTFSSSSKLSTLLTWNISEMQVEHAGGYISCDNLRKYLIGETSCLTSEKSEFIIDEPKVGITRSHRTLATEEGMLYRINMKRFRNSEFGFVVDVDGIDQLPKSALIKLGGEGKGFTYRVICQKTDPISDDDRSTIRDVVRDSGKFKLYLATHAIFDDGWLPKCLHEDIELITAAVGNYVTIGGWNVARRGPKESYRAVPAGSVYYFQVINSEKTDAILDCLHYRNIGDQRTQEGFGLAYVGAVSK